MKTLKQALFSLTAVAMLTLASPLVQAKESGCGARGTWADFHAGIVSAFPEATEHAIAGEAKNAIIAHYNSTPPASAVTPDNVRYLTQPENPVVIIVLQNKECVIGTAYMPVAMLRMILDPRRKGIEV